MKKKRGQKVHARRFFSFCFLRCLCFVRSQQRSATMRQRSPNPRVEKARSRNSGYVPRTAIWHIQKRLFSICPNPTLNFRFYSNNSIKIFTSIYSNILSILWPQNPPIISLTLIQKVAQNPPPRFFGKWRWIFCHPAMDFLPPFRLGLRLVFFSAERY